MNNTISKSTISNDALEANANAMYDENYTGDVNNESEIIVPIQIDGYENYFISNMGRVFSNKRQ